MTLARNRYEKYCFFDLFVPFYRSAVHPPVRRPLAPYFLRRAHKSILRARIFIRLAAVGYYPAKMFPPLVTKIICRAHFFIHLAGKVLHLATIFR